MKRATICFRVCALICAFCCLIGQSRLATADDQNKKLPDKNNNNKVKNRATDTSQQEKGSDVISVQVELVLLDVAVMDHSHRAVSGLARNQFQVFEDKIKQHIEFFSHEDVPVSVGFVIDTSGSMRLKLPSVIQAAKTMVRLARPGDEFFVVEFKENAQLLEEFTSNVDEVQNALDDLTANKGTALLDAIYLSADYAFREAKNRRKALVVITDGDERDSNYKPEQLLDRLREQDVQVYVIGFPDGLSDSNGWFHNSLRNKAVKLINEIADESGGRAFFPTCLYDVSTLTEQIGNDLHAQYTIGYFPSNDKQDGSWRRVQVKLEDNSRKDLAVRTRSGYFAGHPQNNQSNQKSNN